jgi:hypothetical protein
MNKFEERYVDNLMKNHSLDTDESDQKDIQIGGSDNDYPDGGFPPIFSCAQKEIVEDENRNREYSKHKNAISIKQIMEKRRNTTPFVAPPP